MEGEKKVRVRMGEEMGAEERVMSKGKRKKERKKEKERKKGRRSRQDFCVRERKRAGGERALAL